jgi:hypothetical protein
VPLAARTRILASALVAGLLLTVLALLPVGAGAQDAVKPTPCGGEMLITDPAGDPATDTPYQDIKGVFLNFKGGKLTANLQIANLSKELPFILDSQGGAYWYVFYTDGDTRRFVKAVNADGESITYAHGTLDPDSGVFTTVGDTTGQFIEGADGVISIEIPAAAGGAADKTLAGVMATADDILGLDDFIGLNQNVDVAPDGASVTDGSGGGVPYTVAECPAETTTPTTPTTPTTTELPLKVTKVLDGAKKAAKKKALRLTVNATNTITDLSLALKGKSGSGPTFASAKAASVNGTKTLKLKVLKPKKLKKGTYTLIAKGTLNGTKLSAKLKVTVKK